MNNFPEYYKNLNFVIENGTIYSGWYEPQFKSENHGWFIDEVNDILFDPKEVTAWKYIH